MKFTRLIVSLAAALAACLAARPAEAVIMTYTSSAAFFAALGSPPTFLEDYEGEPVDSIIFSGGQLNDISYTFPAEINGRIDNSFNAIDTQSLAAERDGNPGPGAGDFFFPGESIFLVLPEQAYAIGVFINADPNSDEYFLDVPSIGTVASSGTYDLTTFYFVGLISDTPFTNVEIGASIDAPSGYNIDNLTYHNVAVPEPATLATIGLGAMGLLLARRWRRRG